MNIKLKELLARFDHPEFATMPEGGDKRHVCQIWEDGEVTLTKGGSLFGLRNLHQIRPPHPRGALPLDTVPHRTQSHGFVYARYDDSEAIRAMILAEIDLDIVP